MIPPPAADSTPDHLAYLYSRLDYERLGMPGPSGMADFRIGRMRRLLSRLGDPQHGLAIVHIAGTKGKGSTGMLLASALAASGVRTGLFSSPHLHRVEERFQIDGQAITTAELARLVELVRPVVADLDASDPHFLGRGVTFFEITTALGLLFFAQERAGTVVLEVGMGGRLDSTNAVRPSLAVLTSISLDHTRQLGSTLGAIAREKAGIIKRRSAVVSAVRGAEARAVIEQIAAARFARLHAIDRDYTFRYEPPRSPLSQPTPGRVAVSSWAGEWDWTPVPLLGEHQGTNAATALASLDALRELGVADVGPPAVARGWAGLRWPARVEVFGRDPLIVIDGAHNVASAVALADTLRTHFPPLGWTLVFGTTREKDLPGQVAALLPQADRVVVTRYIENARAVPPAEVAAAVVDLSVASRSVPITSAATPAEALALARQQTPPGGAIVVTGSLFLAAEMRAILLSEAAPNHSGDRH